MAWHCPAQRPLQRPASGLRHPAPGFVPLPGRHMGDITEHSPSQLLPSETNIAPCSFPFHFISITPRTYNAPRPKTKSKRASPICPRVLQMDHRLTTSCGFFHPTFPMFFYFCFQLPQVESNRTTAHLWSRFCLNRCATDRYLCERQADPYRCCNWQRNMQIRIGTHSTMGQPTIYPTFLGLHCSHSSGNHTRWQAPCSSLFILIHPYLSTSSPTFVSFGETSSAYTRHFQSE
jgi:hypothetical protein